MKATFFTVSALLATAFAAPASKITARANYDIKIQITDNFSGRSASLGVPSDGYRAFIKDFPDVANILKDGVPVGTSAQFLSGVSGVQCKVTNGDIVLGGEKGILTNTNTFVDFDEKSIYPQSLEGFYVRCDETKA